MGSHGGATAEGQRHLLGRARDDRGVASAPRSAPRWTPSSSPTPTAGTPVHLDANAAAADRFLPVNRIKPHTCFKGPIESGCMKMAVVGFGKQPGAALVHSCGPVEMRDRLLDACAALRETRPAARRRRFDRVDRRRRGARRGPRRPTTWATEFEHELTEYARTLVPALPFDEIDVLIIELRRQGHQRHDDGPERHRPLLGARPRRPAASPGSASIVLLDLTDISGGNALGIGFADFIPASLANQLDFRKTYINCFTAGPAGMRRARMPMVLPDEESCIKAALSMCGRGPAEPKRVVRIRSTLHLTTCHVSDSLLPSSTYLVGDSSGLPQVPQVTTECVDEKA